MEEDERPQRCVIDHFPSTLKVKRGLSTLDLVYASSAISLTKRRGQNGIAVMGQNLTKNILFA
jgi:hypothetical protein